MPHDRMDDFGVAIDPRTGELRSLGAPRRRSLGGPWKPLAIAASVVLVALVVVFAAALVMELL